MDLKKIGKFIAKKRQEKGYTQESLAEELDISNRSISKWERGICLPETTKMPALCELFDITINDLFSGEIVDMKNNEKMLEKNLLELAKQKEQKDKQLLALEWVLGGIGLVTFFAFLFLAIPIAETNFALATTMFITGFVVFMVAMFFGLKIEQIAGYYKCAECGHKHVPTFKAVFVAMHMGRTRHLRCPKCGKKSWQKKVL
ncbi:helix-turn-helix domain-containing protein [Candidatus Saccharibacteria bacterium]|nr:helix-turn-helix domain-containing protein [Candidatus Saccharibacteria bacterium]